MRREDDEASGKDASDQRSPPALATLAAFAALTALSGCASSPTTTYIGPTGAEVTVDWADYPGSPGVDATDVLSAPPEEEIERVEFELVAEIEQALGAEFDLDWQSEGEPPFVAAALRRAALGGLPRRASRRRGRRSASSPGRPGPGR